MKRNKKTYWLDILKLFVVFLKIGAFSFGGGYAMISLIENEVVNKKQWITKTELADIFAIAESTPGPIAINTATYIGVKQGGILGGIVATISVVIPSYVVIVALSCLIEAVKDNVWAGYFFKSIRIGVLVLIAKAVFSFFKDLRKNVVSVALAITAFCLVLLTNVKVTYIILATFVIGALTVATTNFVKKKLYHSVGTPEYFNERIGYKPQKDEYIRISTNSAATDNAVLENSKATLSDGEKARKSVKESEK